MRFSGLETTTISIIGSIVTAAVVRVWMGRSFVSKEACLASREACKEVQSVDQCRVGDKIKAVEESLGDLSRKTARDQAQQYRMLRALVVYSNIPQAQQTEILNDRGE